MEHAPFTNTCDTKPVWEKENSCPVPILGLEKLKKGGSKSLKREACPVPILGLEKHKKKRRGREKEKESFGVPILGLEKLKKGGLSGSHTGARKAQKEASREGKGKGEFRSSHTGARKA